MDGERSPPGGSGGRGRQFPDLDGAKAPMATVTAVKLTFSNRMMDSESMLKFSVHLLNLYLRQCISLVTSASLPTNLGTAS